MSGLSWPSRHLAAPKTKRKRGRVEAAFNGYLRKPVDPVALARAVEAFRPDGR